MLNYSIINASMSIIPWHMMRTILIIHIKPSIRLSTSPRKRLIRWIPVMDHMMLQMLVPLISNCKISLLEK